MAKSSHRMVLYEAIQEGKKKPRLSEKIFRKRSVKKRLMKAPKGVNPYDGTEREPPAKPEKQEKKQQWPPPENPVAAVLRKIRIPLKYRLWTLSALAGLLVVMLLVQVSVFIFSAKPQEPADRPAALPEGTDMSELTPAERVERKLATGGLNIGDHVIVIVQYPKKTDLEPVQRYFEVKGVDTEILKKGKYFFLITKRRFESPKREGSGGYIMKERIREIGAGYEAPAGFETFGSKPFQDAYGMKVE